MSPLAEREFWPGAAANVNAIRNHRDEPLKQAEADELQQLIQILMPTTLEERIRAFVLRGGRGFWDDLDWRDIEGAMTRVNAEAISLGRQTAKESNVLGELLPELMMVSGSGTMSAFAQALVEESLHHQELWDALRESYAACDSEERVGDLLAECIHFLRALDFKAAEEILTLAVEDDALTQVFPSLQARAGLYETWINRIHRSISSRLTRSASFLALGSATPELTDEQLAMVFL